MVVQHMLWEGQKVPAVIDNGAVVPVCLPELVNRLGLTVKPWQANWFVAIDRKEIKPGGKVTPWRYPIGKGRIYPGPTKGNFGEHFFSSKTAFRGQEIRWGFVLRRN